jgi:acetyl-CoA synthetase (ADP-forming)
MKAKEIITRAKGEDRNLFEPEAYQLLDSFGIPVPKCGIAATENEALTLSNSIGYAVALKVVSPQIIHKSDVDAVVLNLNSDEEVRDVYAQLLAAMENIDPKIDLRGVLVSKMMPKGTEVIIGMTRDPQFGPAVLFGLGGIFVEALKDVSYRVAPVTEKDARQMIGEIKGYPLLRGVRNIPPSDIKAIIEIIQKVSELADEMSEIAELDLNPVLVYEKGACVVDARIILGSAKGTS